MRFKLTKQDTKKGYYKKGVLVKNPKVAKNIKEMYDKNYSSKKWNKERV